MVSISTYTGKPSFTKKQADLFFPPDFQDDFPVAMQVMSVFFTLWNHKLHCELTYEYLILQISHKYSLIYVITKLGLLFVYDLETATAVYRNRISPDPIFLTSEASSVGGFYAVNRRGQVLLATVNESTIVPFVSGQVSISLYSILDECTFFFSLEFEPFVNTVVEQLGTCCQSC